MVCQAEDLGSIPRLGRFPGGEQSHGQRSLGAGHSSWGHKVGHD